MTSKCSLVLSEDFLWHGQLHCHEWLSPVEMSVQSEIHESIHIKQLPVMVVQDTIDYRIHFGREAGPDVYAHRKRT